MQDTITKMFAAESVFEINLQIDNYLRDNPDYAILHTSITYDRNGYGTVYKDVVLIKKEQGEQF